MTPTEDINRTHTAEPHEDSPNVAQNVALLVVPKSWTRLVVAAVSLLGLVVTLVTAIVFFSWNQARDNADRILDLQNEVTCLKARVSPCPPRTAASDKGQERDRQNELPGGKDDPSPVTRPSPERR